MQVVVGSNVPLLLLVVLVEEVVCLTSTTSGIITSATIGHSVVK